MKSKVLAGIAGISLCLVLAGCSSNTTDAPEPSKNSVSPVGSWGTVAEDGGLDLSQPWVSFSGDGTMAGSFGKEDCSPIQGKWNEQESSVEIMASANILNICSDDWVASAVKANVAEDSLTLLDSRGKVSGTVPFISASPNLYTDAMSKRMNEKAKEIVGKVGGSDGIAESENSSGGVSVQIEEQQGERF